MPDDYRLPPRKARICRWAGWFFALAAALIILSPITALPLTGHPLKSIACNVGETCAIADESLDALDEDVRVELVATPGARERYAGHVARPPIVIALTALAVMSRAPLATLLLGVAMALLIFGSSTRSGGRRRPGPGSALRWLRISAIAAVVAAIWPPVDVLLEALLLLPGTPFGPGWMLEVDFGPLFLHLMLALATFAVVWALEAGQRAQADLAEIV